MSARRIFFLFMCRNCAHSLNAWLDMLTELDGHPGLQVYAIFGENGSIDGTHEILQHAVRFNHRMNVVDTGFMVDIPERLKRMAAGREALLKSLPPPKLGDVVLVADADLELVHPLSDVLLLAALDELDQPMTTGVCSYSLPVHYDIMALRETESSWSPPLDSHLAKLGPSGLLSCLWRFPRLCRNTLMTARIQRQLGVASGKTFVSAFNGLCLYPRPLYDEVSYIAAGVECEHVVINLAMHRRTSGLIRVSQYLGVRAPVEHVVSIPKSVRKVCREIASSLFPRTGA